MKVELTPKSFYAENISLVRDEMRKLKPYSDEFMDIYHPTSVGHHRNQMKSKLNNYLNGNSYITGLELGWNTKILEFIR